MSRSTIWAVVATISAAVLLAAWFWRTFDRILVDTPPVPKAEAIRDRYLALERMSTRLGHPLMVSGETQRLDTLPPKGVVVLDAERGRSITPGRAAALLKWAEDGGHLIVAANFDPSDPLMKALQVRASFERPVVSPRPRANDPFEAPPRYEFDVRLANLPRPLRASLPRWPGALKSTASADWSAGGADGPAILHFARGHGAVTVLLGLPLIADNLDLGHRDNAALIWTLLNLVNPGAPVLFLTRIHATTLWEWLAESAWMVVLAAAVLIVLALWRAVPRFGPRLDDPIPERRALTDHLEAMGRAVWRAKEEAGLAYWLYCARRSVLARAGAREPAIIRKPPLEQARFIAARLGGRRGLDEKLVRTAIAGTATAIDGAVAREGFARAVAILQRVEQNL